MAEIYIKIPAELIDNEKPAFPTLNELWWFDNHTATIMTRQGKLLKLIGGGEKYITYSLFPYDVDATSNISWEKLAVDYLSASDIQYDNLRSALEDFEKQKVKTTICAFSNPDLITTGTVTKIKKYEFPMNYIVEKIQVIHTTSSTFAVSDKQRRVITTTKVTRYIAKGFSCER